MTPSQISSLLVQEASDIVTLFGPSHPITAEELASVLRCIAGRINTQSPEELRLQAIRNNQQQ